MSEHYVVLSRKYRPKYLNDLIGQDVLSKSLRSCLDSKRVPHAFLFHGIRGVGKTTTARILARCLSCIGTDGMTDITSNPCGICRSCIALDHDQHMDIMEFDAASRTGVDDIREIIDATQYSPVLGRYKIFIVDEVHMLSKSAFNALLKTLEEPPSHVKFIFATTEIHKIPETILSRCMTFKLNPISHDSLSEYLVEISRKEGYILNKDAANIIAEESEGSVRDALSILEQALMLCFDSKEIGSESLISMLGSARPSDIKEILHLILNAKTKEALSKSEALIKNGSDPTVLYRHLQTELYSEIVRHVYQETNQYSLSNLLYLWQIFINQTESIRRATHPGSILNAAIVIMSHTASFPKVEDLLINTNGPNISSTSTQTKLASKIEGIIGDKVSVKEDKSSKLIDSLMSKFPGSTISNIE